MLHMRNTLQKIEISREQYTLQTFNLQNRVLRVISYLERPAIVTQ